MARYRDEVQNLVNEKWDISQDYSDEMWDKFLDFFDQMRSQINQLGTPTLDFSAEISQIAEPGSFSPVVPDVSKYLIDFNIPPIPNAPDIETSYASDLLLQLQSKLATDLETGGVPFSETVQEMIYEAAKKRQDLDNERKYNEAENYFASRGWIMPPGALAGRLAEANKEIQRANEQLNREIMINQADIAKQHEQFLVQTVQNLEQVMIDFVMKQANLQLETYKGEIEGITAQINANSAWASLQGQLFGMEIEGFKAVVALDEAKINAAIETSRAQVARDEAYANLALKEAEINLQAALEVSDKQLSAIESAAALAAQIVASSMSAVSAGVRMSYSGGYDYLYDYNHSSDYSNFFVNP